MLAIVTGLLWWSSEKLWKANENQLSELKRAAVAAERSAKAAIGIELPIIRMYTPMLVTRDSPDPKDWYGGMINDGPLTRYSGVNELKIVNVGRTPAFLSKIDVGWACASILPQQPIMKHEVRCASHEIVREKEEGETDIKVNFLIALTESEVIEANNGTAPLWFYGVIHYRDFLDEPHERGFCLWRHRLNETQDYFVFDRALNAPPAYVRQT